MDAGDVFAGFKTLFQGVQILFVAFGALVLVPLLTGLDPGVALCTAGIGTLIFQAVTGMKVPVFLASSFAFVPAITYGVAAWGVPGVMVGHIACPALDPAHPDRPASLSPELVTGLLRGRMDYQQVVITDDMSMGAIGLSKPEACVQALGAGCDAVIVFGSVPEMRAVCAAIDAAIGNGRLSREQLATSAARLDAWSRRVREFPEP